MEKILKVVHVGGNEGRQMFLVCQGDPEIVNQLNEVYQDVPDLQSRPVVLTQDQHTEITNALAKLWG